MLKYKIKRFFSSSAKSLNNVKINYAISPLYFLLVLAVERGLINFHPVLDKMYGPYGILRLALISTAIYCYASAFFQPDLDVRNNRPGQAHFPFGKWVTTVSLGRFLHGAAYPINRLWFWLWQPYAELLTHRGIGHWPVIGTWVRVSYLYIWFWGFGYGLWTLGVHLPFLVSIEYWFRSFFPWNFQFGSPMFFTYAFPVFVSDLMHIVFDFYDSTRKGNTFCPPQISRGLLIKGWMYIKEAVTGKADPRFK